MTHHFLQLKVSFILLIKSNKHYYVFFFKKKNIPHIRLTGVIGNAGKFRQGLDFSGQEEIIKESIFNKKSPAVAITVNSPGGSPVQSHLIYNFIREQAKENKKSYCIC